MSTKRDKVTAWAKENGQRIEDHWGQPLPKTAGMIFGSSYFGFAQRTLSPIIPGEWSRYTMGLNPMILAGDPGDAWDDILDRAKMLAGSIAGNYLSDWLNRNHRDYLEKLREDSGGNLYGLAESGRYNQKIEDRGYLEFSYVPDAVRGLMTDPGDDILSSADRSFQLPFFENPKISESRSAVYASHTIVNQNEPYRLWTSAKPTKLSLSFSITLPHLMTFATEHMKIIYNRILQTTYFKYDTFKFIEEKIKSFYPSDPPTDVSALSDYGKDRYELTHTILKDVLFEVGSATDGLTNPTFKSQAIIYSLYIINLIRSSVIGSSNMSVHQDHVMNNDDDFTYDVPPSNNTGTWDSPPNEFITTTTKPSNKYLPPPVIYLTHGALYQEAPFIATGYSINFDGKKGYEELSLLPRVINIKLTLESYDQINLGRNVSTPKGMLKLFKGDKYVTETFN